jgi:hypothetical protein
MLKKTERKGQGKFYIEGKYQKKKRKGKSSIKQCQRARGKKKAIKSIFPSTVTLKILYRISSFFGYYVTFNNTQTQS